MLAAPRTRSASAEEALEKMSSPDYLACKGQQVEGYHEGLPANVKLSRCYCSDSILRCNPGWRDNRGRACFCNRYHPRPSEIGEETRGLTFEKVREREDVAKGVIRVATALVEAVQKGEATGYVLVGFDIEGQPQAPMTFQFAVRDKSSGQFRSFLIEYYKAGSARREVVEKGG